MFSVLLNGSRHGLLQKLVSISLLLSVLLSSGPFWGQSGTCDPKGTTHSLSYKGVLSSLDLELEGHKLAIASIVFVNIVTRSDSRAKLRSNLLSLSALQSP